MGPEDWGGPGSCVWAPRDWPSAESEVGGDLEHKAPGGWRRQARGREEATGQAQSRVLSTALGSGEATGNPQKTTFWGKGGKPAWSGDAEGWGGSGPGAGALRRGSQPGQEACSSPALQLQFRDRAGREACTMAGVTGQTDEGEACQRRGHVGPMLGPRRNSWEEIWVHLRGRPGDVETASSAQR